VCLVQKFKDQMAALSAATIRLAATGEETADATQTLHGKLEIVDNFDLWFPKNPNQRVLWSSTVELSAKYFQTLIRHAVPLQRAIAALSHNARALDIHTSTPDPPAEGQAGRDQAFLPLGGLEVGAVRPAHPAARLHLLGDSALDGSRMNVDHIQPLTCA
jgi:hypothetical protein